MSSQVMTDILVKFLVETADPRYTNRQAIKFPLSTTVGKAAADLKINIKDVSFKCNSQPYQESTTLQEILNDLLEDEDEESLNALSIRVFQKYIGGIKQVY